MDYDIVVIGAGVVGLAVAMKLSQKRFNVLIVEKNKNFGQETSSRNSEVIHAGLYYPQNTLKTKLCIEGNRLLYEFCERNNVPYRKIGKFVIAIEENDINKLEEIYSNAMNNGVRGIERIPIEKFKNIEPNIIAKEVFFSSETGIIDSHKFMYALERIAIQNGCDFAYLHEVTHLQKNNDEWQIQLKFNQKELINLSAKFIINCAGLYSDKIAEMTGIDTKMENLDIKFCKGNYFKIKSYRNFNVNHLVYPITAGKHGLGIHLTVDLNGDLKLGPDSEYLIENIQNYDVSEDLLEKFFYAGSRYIKNLQKDDLFPDYSGIRPKIQKPEENFRDFYINDESSRVLYGLINLIGIESPGLTSCLSIANYINNLIESN